MASNDTNFWDKDPDELLRQRWQRAFDHFEVQSRPSLRRRVLDQVTVGHRRKPAAWLAGGVLLLLLSVGVVYTLRQENRSESAPGNIAGIQPRLPDHSERVGRVHQPAVPNGRSVSSGQSVTIPLADASVAGRQPMLYQSAVRSTKIIGHEVSSGRRVATADRNGLRPSVELILRPNAPSASQPIAELGRSQSTRFPTASSDPTEPGGREIVAAPAEQVISDTRAPIIGTQPLVIRPSTTTPTVEWARLKTRTMVPLPSSLNTLPGQLPVTGLALTHPADVAVSRARPHKQWFVDAVPLSSFQWMSAAPTSTAYLTQVDAPAVFSPATWGYQFNGGIRWQRWQAYLSVGQLRRWAYYTVNENRYRIEPTPADPYRLVREMHAVAENVALPMVGIGMSRYRLLSQGRYVVELGGQLSYLPTSGQTLAELRGGASRRLSMGRRTELQAGLTVEYGLNRLMSEQKQLAIHPIVVGVSFRVQPRSGQ